MPSQYTAHALPALPGQGYGPKLMFLLLSTALKEKGKKNGHTEYMANFFWANLELKVMFNSQIFSIYLRLLRAIKTQKALTYEVKALSLNNELIIA